MRDIKDIRAELMACDEEIAKLAGEEEKEATAAAREAQWKNKAITELTEPGSVFKVITSAIALEENITTTDKSSDFYCSGYEQVEDRSIRCWQFYKPHGHETLRDSLVNSCNPALIQLARRIGAKTLYKYYDAYGFFNKTNVGLSGEASGIFHTLKNVGPVEQATMSFGQRFTITPLQMINLCFLKK